LSVGADGAVEFRRATEVQQQTDLEPGRAQVVVELPFRVAMQVFGRLDLDHHFVIDDHVESLMRDLGAVVLDEDVQLPIDTVAAMSQLSFERGCKNVFEKAEPECPVKKKAPITERVSSSSIKCIANDAHERSVSRHRSISSG
jgi:hypothetical protein